MNGTFRVRINAMSKVALAGQRFGLLVAIAPAEPTPNGRTRWLCRCDCGRVKVIRTQALRDGTTRSCGCRGSGCTRDFRIKHQKLYHAWRAMIARCTNPRHMHYAHYGLRGIAVCPEWRSNFKLFATWAMKNGHSDDLTLDRIDVDGNYEPSNCRWVSMHEQSRNKTNSRYVTIDGERLVMKDAADRYGIRYTTLRQRLNRGWSAEDAVRKSTGPGFRIKSLTR